MSLPFVTFRCDGSGLPMRLSGNEPACHAGDIKDVGLLPESGRSPGGGHGSPLQYSRLGRSRDRGAWWESQSDTI